ncbi:MAG: arylesterase [Chloroherpetonaceae bacterium]|nr:arylesterase [Chloroherpetonaceae bacterium]
MKSNIAVLLFFMIFNIGVSAQVKTTEERVVLFLGDSITAGLGLSLEESFPFLLQQRVDSLNLNAKLINAGLSGETSAGGLRRAPWLFKQKVDILVLELGGNDGLRGIEPNATKVNLKAIIDLAREKNPRIEIILAGIQVPPNLGKKYRESFSEIFPAIAKEKKVRLIPFILEGVGGNPKLNLPDGIHPTAEGHRILAETVWKQLKLVL